MAKSFDSQSGPIPVSCPGGMARQFRVQIASSETPSQWKLAGSFRDGADARRCAEDLGRAGAKTRILSCQALPTAA